VKRRELIVGVGVAAILWPYTVPAQQKALPVIGFLSARSPQDSAAQWLRFGKAWPNRALADERSRFEAAKVEHDAREAAFGEHSRQLDEREREARAP